MHKTTLLLIVFELENIMKGGKQKCDIIKLKTMDPLWLGPTFFEHTIECLLCSGIDGRLKELIFLLTTFDLSHPASGTCPLN